MTDQKFRNEILIFFSCELLCFSILNFLHIKWLDSILYNLNYYIRNFPSVSAFMILFPIFLSVLFLFWTFIENKKLILILSISIITAIASYISMMNSIESFLNSYFSYLLILTALWGFLSLLHKYLLRQVI